jgi:hypothetical protein
MHAIVNGTEVKYVDLKAAPGGHLILNDGNNCIRYSFDVIEFVLDPFLEIIDLTRNLVEVEKLAYGKGKWMLGSDCLLTWLEQKENAALAELNNIRSKNGLTAFSLKDFNDELEKSPQLHYSRQTSRERYIDRRINSEFFTPLYARRWGLSALLRSHGSNSKLREDVCAAAWFEGSKTPVLLRRFEKVEAASALPEKELTITDAFLWKVQNEIMEELDRNVRAIPLPSQVFIRYCRDRMKQADMSRKYGWNARTVKNRKRSLISFLKRKYKFTLETFFVDRSIFSAAERMKEEYKGKFFSMRGIGECSLSEEQE